MKIRVRCDCGKALVASDQLAGKKTKCPACGAVIRLPLLDAEPGPSVSFDVMEARLNLPSSAATVATDTGPDDKPFAGATIADEADSFPVVMGDSTDWSAVGGSFETAADSFAKEEPLALPRVRKPMQDELGGELSTIPRLWVALITMVLNSLLKIICRVGQARFERRPTKKSLCV